MCNCNNTTTTTQKHVCKPTCPPQEDCTCPVQIKSSCVTMYDGNDLECSGIKSGLPLNQTIELLDNHICEAIDEINASINLVNVGTGEDIYAGIDGIGRRKIKRVNTDSNILTITPNTDDITFGIDEEALDTFIEENQKTYSVANVGTDPLRVNVYKDSTIVGDNTQFNFRSLTSTGSSVIITQGLDTINLEVDIDPTVFLEDGVTTTISGDGVTTPYSVEIENLQKTINTFPYTLTSGDDKYTIFVANDASNVIINVPDNLVDNFCCTFIQKGTGEVAVITTGTSSLSYPSTLQNVIKGQNFWALIEKELNLNNYFLIGSLKTV